MPNRQYEKGARAERDLMRLAEECGASVYRGAGSHGAYDVAITARDGGRYLVNVKCNRWAPPHERARLAQICTDADTPILAMKLDRKGWLYRAIDGLGDLGAVYSIAPWQ